MTNLSELTIKPDLTFFETAELISLLREENGKLYNELRDAMHTISESEHRETLWNVFEASEITLGHLVNTAES